jgi:hypothetical protein
LLLIVDITESQGARAAPTQLKGHIMSFVEKRLCPFLVLIVLTALFDFPTFLPLTSSQTTAAATQNFDTPGGQGSETTMVSIYDLALACRMNSLSFLSLCIHPFLCIIAFFLVALRVTSF